MSQIPVSARREQGKTATIRDVARAAGVSTMTVSRVINGSPSVSPATLQRVEAAIRQLDFAPNPAARSLAGVRRLRIGLPYSIPSAAYLSDFLVGSMDQASVTPLQFLVERCAASAAVEDTLLRLIDSGVDGMILPPPLCDSRAARDILRDRQIPAVAVATGGAIDGIASVSIDDHGAAYAMTRHIVELGHRRIGFVRGDPGHSATGRRLNGYRRALAEAGLEVEEALIVEGRFTYRSGLDAAEQLLNLPNPPTAIFASNDDMAAAAIAVAHQRGFEVPGDLTICGFDDTSIATTIWPELTTVHQPIKEMATAAVQLLVDILRSDDGMPARHITFDYVLMRRQSDAVTRLRPRIVA